MLAYARAHSSFSSLQLVNGTQAFTPSIIGLVPLGF